MFMTADCTIGLRRAWLGRRIYKRKAVLSIRVKPDIRTTLPLCATGAFSGILPVRAVGFGALGHEFELGVVVDLRGAAGTMCPSVTAYAEEKMCTTYVAHRAETTALLPFGQATARGFWTIPPPQAIPAQPISLGTTS